MTESITDDILALVDAHDGRVDYTTLTEDLDWSNAYISMTITNLDADGTIAKVPRLGAGPGPRYFVCRPDSVPAKYTTPSEEYDAQRGESDD